MALFSEIQRCEYFAFKGNGFFDDGNDIRDVEHGMLRQRLPNRWTSQLDLGCTTGCLERVVSVHNST